MVARLLGRPLSCVGIAEAPTHEVPMPMGRNMQAFLTTIRAEPGQWTTASLAKDYGVKPGSARRTLRNLESLGLVKRRGEYCGSCGSKVERWYPVNPSSPPSS